MTVGQSYTLRSDLAGEVFMKAVSPGMELAFQYGGGAPIELFTIGQTDKVWVRDVVVNVASWPEKGFDGKVDWISGALYTSTHATKVRCSFDNPDGALKPEMFATVRISVDVKKARLRGHGVTLQQVQQAVQNANVNSGGQRLEMGEQSYDIRGIGLLRNVHDIDETVIVDVKGTPVRVRDVAEEGPRGRRRARRLSQIGVGLGATQRGHRARAGTRRLAATRVQRSHQLLPRLRLDGGRYAVKAVRAHRE